MATQSAIVPSAAVEVQALTKDEAASAFEGVVRRYLKMSTAQFLERLDSGFFRQHPELDRRVDSVAFYLPLIRR